MNSLAAIAAALALVVPAAGASVVKSRAPAAHEAPELPGAPEMSSARPGDDAFRAFRDSYRPQAQDQVRIEQHVIIRISPSPPSMRREIFGQTPHPDDPLRFKEKKGDRCVAIDDIAGITPMEPNRLVLFMRDHRMLSVALERACDADAFYLGAYIARGSDGKLCTGRDSLRARTGATCRVARISRLVPVRD
jgi:hypothetical protein